MKLPMKRYYPTYKNQKAKVEHMDRSSLKSIICELSAYSLCCRDIDCFRSKVVFLGWTRRSYRHTNYSHRGETCSAVNEQHVQSKKSEMKWMTMMLGWLPSLTSLRALRTNAQVISARSHRQCFSIFCDVHMTTKSKTESEFSRVSLGEHLTLVGALLSVEECFFRSGKRQKFAKIDKTTFTNSTFVVFKIRITCAVKSLGFHRRKYKKIRNF